MLLPHFITPFSASRPVFIVGQTESGYALLITTRGYFATNFVATQV
jgi:hypothetical protein